MKCCNVHCDWREEFPCLCPKCGALIYDERLEKENSALREVLKGLLAVIAEKGVISAIHHYSPVAQKERLNQLRKEAKSILATSDSRSGK